jgi:KUP system potassium uptake protein
MTNAGRVDGKLKKSDSILQKKDLRAEEMYWFVHVNILTEPQNRYKVTEIVKDDLYRVDFNLGLENLQKIVDV